MPAFGSTHGDNVMPFQDLSLIDYEALQKDALESWKRSGSKILGYVCSAVPVELIYGAGIAPVRMIGREIPIAAANSKYTNYSCYFARSIYELADRGEYGLLDGTVFTYSCDCLRGLVDKWQYDFDQLYFYFLVRPQNSDVPGALDFFVKELHDFQRSLEDFVGKKMTQEALQESIRLYNSNRELLSKINGARGERITGSAALELTFAAMLLPPHEGNRLLQKAWSDLPSASLTFRGPRLALVGTALSNARLPALIENCGGMVVADDLCTGYRAWSGSVQPEGDLLRNLAAHYLHGADAGSQCPVISTKGRLPARLNSLLSFKEQGRIDGVVFATQRYCDPQQLDNQYLFSALGDRNIPALKLEVEESVDASQTQTRIEAFLELAEQRRNN